MQVNELVRQKDSESKELCKAEKHMRRWIGKKKIELSSRDSDKGGESVSLGAGQPRVLLKYDTCASLQRAELQQRLKKLFIFSGSTFSQSN